MDYEKAYKEALERAIVAHKDEDRHIKATLERIFPELKESEDEKIRKEIAEFIYITPFKPRDIKKKERWLTWLEKQGEKDIKYNYLEDLLAFDNIYQMAMNDVTAEEAMNIAVAKCFEQGTTNKAEPKFHEGDWLCENESNNYARYIQILEIVNVQGKERYRISRDLHNDEDIVECQFVDDNWHSFCIQDIKDGDILVNGSNIFIFHYINNTRLMGYCHVNTDDGRFYNDIGKNECFCLIDAVVNPATKEQRAILIKTMAEAGYTFNFKKKKLKKIEQKSAWNEEDEHGFENCLYAIKETFKGVDNPRRVGTINFLKSLKDRYTWKLGDGQNLLPQTNERAYLYLVADVLTWQNGIGQYLDDPRVQQLAKNLQKKYNEKIIYEKTR